MTPTTAILFLGYFASALVFATFFMRSRARLREVAIASNVAFMLYGTFGHVIPVLVLHALLFPLNIWRLWEINRTKSGILSAIKGDLRMDWLEPFAQPVELNAGEQLFAQNDLGDKTYFIVSGRMHLPQSGIDLGPGSLLGEVAMFSPEHRRTQSAVASTETRLLSMTQDELFTLYRRNPDFGVYLLRLVTARLLENERLLEGPY
jgi:CRP/FNR family cyclic AMP-dependent transcriptional regulator